MALRSGVTTYPALTTTFTAPVSCSTELFTLSATSNLGQSSSSTITTLYQLWEWAGPRPDLTSTFDYSCLPPGFLSGPNVYSPGVCADGSSTVTSIQTYGTDVAICCPSGYTLTDHFQFCASNYATPTLANAITFVSESSTVRSEVHLSTTVGPGIKLVRAAFLIQPTSTTNASHSVPTSTTTSGAGYGKLLAQLDRWETQHNQDVSNGALVGIIVGSVIFAAILLLIGFFILKRKSTKQRESKQTNPSHLLNTVSTLFIPVIISTISGIALCLLASQQPWQQEIIRRWNSPNIILRIVQVLSFVMRLCATVVCWCLIADQAWLLMCRGLPIAQFVRLCDVTASGGSYLTLWHSFVSSVSKRSALGASLLLLSLVLALTSDLTGTAIIASTGAKTVDGWNSATEIVPFTQVGYIGTSEPSFGGEDQIKAVLSSTDYYPHIIRTTDDMFTFLPVQAGNDAPSSYRGVSYLGTLNVTCFPATLQGTIMSFFYGSGGRNGISMSGSLQTPYDTIPDTSNVSFNIQNLSIQSQDFANPQPILAAWRIDTADTNSDTGYFATLAITGLNESFVTANLRDTPASNGPLQINDGSSGRIGETGGFFSIHACRAIYPTEFGLAYLPQMERTARSSAPCWTDNGLCPNMTVLEVGSAARFVRWTPNQVTEQLGASFVDSHTAQQALAPFSDGVVFCRSCSAPNLAAKILSTYVAVTSIMHNNETTSLASALQTTILHALAVTYRNELPFLNGKGPAIFSVPEPATLITNSSWIYAIVAYVWLLNIVCFLVHRYTLAVVGTDRSGSALTVASIIAQDDKGHLNSIVSSKDASWKGKNEMWEYVDKTPAEGTVKLGWVGEQQDRFGVGYSSSIVSKRPGISTFLYHQVDSSDSQTSHSVR